MLNFTAAFVIVYLLLFFANRFGARAAGVINGVPLIAGASYVLLGIEQGEIYSSLAASENSLGANISLLTLCLYILARQIKIPIIFSGLLCCAAFIGISVGLSQFNIDPIAKLMLGFTGLLCFHIFFSKLPESEGISSSITPTQKQILIQAFLGAALIWGVALAGNYVPDIIAGKLVALPIPALAILIVLEKNKGLLSLNSFLKVTTAAFGINVFYTTMVWLLYPAIGIIYGTIIAYLSIIPLIWFCLKKTK